MISRASGVLVGGNRGMHVAVCGGSVVHRPVRLRKRSFQLLGNRNSGTPLGGVISVVPVRASALRFGTGMRNS